MKKIFLLVFLNLLVCNIDYCNDIDTVYADNAKIEYSGRFDFAKPDRSALIIIQQ